MHQDSLPLSYWFDALATATFLINRLPSSKLAHLSLFERLYHHSLDFTLLKVFVVFVILGFVLILSLNSNLGLSLVCLLVIYPQLKGIDVLIHLQARSSFLGMLSLMKLNFHLLLLIFLLLLSLQLKHSCMTSFGLPRVLLHLCVLLHLVLILLDLAPL